MSVTRYDTKGRRFVHEGSSRHFAWYGLRDADRFACSCGWSGRFDDMNQEQFRELMDGSCPKCATTLVIRNFPTPRHTRAAARAGDKRAARELKDLDDMQRRGRKLRRRELRPDSKLPDLAGDKLRFEWDWEKAKGEEWTVIRCGDVVVWRELSWFECYPRFNEVKAILKQRFGDRFAGLHPTEVSLFDLYGDRISAHVTPD